MRLLLILVMAAGSMLAADAPDTRDAEIAALKAQVAALQVEVQVEKAIKERAMEIAQLPEVMRARLAVIDTAAAFKAAQEAAKPKVEPAKP